MIHGFCLGGGLELALAAEGRETEAEAARESFDLVWRAADVELPGSRF